MLNENFGQRMRKDEANVGVEKIDLAIFLVPSNHW